MDSVKSAAEFMKNVDSHNPGHIKQALEMLARETDLLTRRLDAVESTNSAMNASLHALMQAPRGVKAAVIAFFNALSRSFQ